MEAVLEELVVERGRPVEWERMWERVVKATQGETEGETEGSIQEGEEGMWKKVVNGEVGKVRGKEVVQAGGGVRMVYPVASALPTPEEAEVEELRGVLAHMSEEERDAAYEEYIANLHTLNGFRDLAVTILGRLAHAKRVQVSHLFEEYGLPLEAHIE